MNLPYESKQFIKFATAAYGAHEIHAAYAAHHKPPPVMTAGHSSSREAMANYLHIYVKDILYMSRPGDKHTFIPHFVAVNRHSECLVSAIRGTNSCTSVMQDSKAATSK